MLKDLPKILKLKVIKESDINEENVYIPPEIEVIEEKKDVDDNEK